MDSGASIASDLLPDLATQIRDRHNLFEVLARRTAVLASEIGGLLVKAKEHIAHGQWRLWLATETPYSPDQAERLMRLARNAATLRLLPDDTSVSRALELLRAASKHDQQVAALPYLEALHALAAHDDREPLSVVSHHAGDQRAIADQVDLTIAPRRQVVEIVRAGKGAQVELARRRAEAAQERRRPSAEALPAPAPPANPTFRVYRGDNREVLPALDAESVQLVITSPGYGVGWNYADGGLGDTMPIESKLAELEQVLGELLRVLRPGGILALNLPVTIRTPSERAYPLAAWAQLELRRRGYLLREPISWQHQDAHGRPWADGTAIGAPTNPYLRRTRELVLLASKGTYGIPGKGTQWPADSLEWTKDTWTIGPGHALPGGPLAFPDELVRRLVQFFSEPGDVALDPYAGTGTVGRVARELGRASWLIEWEPSYWAALEALAGA